MLCYAAISHNIVKQILQVNGAALTAAQSGVPSFTGLLRTLDTSTGCLASEKKQSSKVFVAFKMSVLEKAFPIKLHKLRWVKA